MQIMDYLLFDHWKNIVFLWVINLQNHFVLAMHKLNDYEFNNENFQMPLGDLFCAYFFLNPLIFSINSGEGFIFRSTWYNCVVPSHKLIAAWAK